MNDIVGIQLARKEITSAGGITTVYTSTLQAQITAIWVALTGAATATIDLYHLNSGESAADVNKILDGYAIAAADQGPIFQAQSLYAGISMIAADFIQVDTDQNITVTLYGVTSVLPSVR